MEDFCYLLVQLEIREWLAVLEKLQRKLDRTTLLFFHTLFLESKYLIFFYKFDFKVFMAYKV